MTRIVPVKAIRIHEDGGPEVLRYEDVPDPVAGPGEVLVSLRAASLNHLDLWVRKGLPSVPKPRILGADGAGIRVDTGERVVINPGLEHGADDHRDRRAHRRNALRADRACRRSNVFPLDDAIDFETAAAFPLVYETAYRMLVTKAQLQEGEWVLIWGIGGGVATAAFEIARALGAKTIVTSELGREARAGARMGRRRRRQPRDRRRRGGREGGRRRRPRRRDRRRGDLEGLARRGQARRPRRRLRRHERPEPAGAAAPLLVEAAHGLRLDDGHARGLPRRLRAVRSGRARVHVDSVFPLAETRAAHERLEARRAARQDRALDPRLAGESARGLPSAMG